MAPALMLAPRHQLEVSATESTMTQWADVWRDTPDRSVVVEDSESLEGLWDYRELAGRRSRLLVMDAVTSDWRPLLDALFQSVITGDEIHAVLPIEQLAEALESSNRGDLFIGGAVTQRAVVLYRGDLRSLVVAREWFMSRPTAKPNFRRLRFDDFGQTVRLGRYEVAADALLYEFDPDYRRRLKRDLVANDPSFGGSLRRLRLQRGLKRSDFAGVSEKEVARIERGEIGRPHARTLRRLADQLHVDPEDIATY